MRYPDRSWRASRPRTQTRDPLLFPSEPNPFERLAAPDAGLLNVYLHGAGLLDLDAEESLILAELASSARREAFKVICTPGGLHPAFTSVPVVEITIDDARDIALGQLTEGESRQTCSIRGVHQYPILAEHWFGDQAAASTMIELLIADRIGADLIVTASPLANALREKPTFEKLNIVSPQEAFPIAGVWSRLSGHAFVHGPINVNTGYYYQALASALTPKSRSGQVALAFGERLFDGGEELYELAGSLAERLDRLTHVLDRMFGTWQRPTNNDTLDDLAADFDAVVLGVSASQDNLALLAGKYFGVALKQPWLWALLHPEWQRAMAKTGDARARRVLDGVNHLRPQILLAQELRQSAVHRALLPTIRVLDSSKPEEGRIRVSAELLGKVKGALEDIGESAVDWGISHEQGPVTIPVVVKREGGDERYERYSSGWAFVDPMPFATRFVGRLANLIDEVFELCDFGSDPRLPQRTRESSASTPAEFPFRDEDGKVAILSSPLSGVTGSMSREI